MVIRQTAMWDSTYDQFPPCLKDKAFDLARRAPTQAVTFAGQGGMISVVGGPRGSAADGWVIWARQRSSCGPRLWWIGSSSRQTDHSAAVAAPSSRGSQPAPDRKDPCGLWVAQRLPRPTERCLSRDLFLHLLFRFFHVDFNAAHSFLMKSLTAAKSIFWRV